MLSLIFIVNLNLIIQIVVYQVLQYTSLNGISRAIDRFLLSFELPLPNLWAILALKVNQLNSLFAV